MNNTFEDLQSGWNKSRESVSSSKIKLDELISSAKSRQRSNLVFHYGNMGVLLLTAIALIVVWQVWMPFQEILSIAGILTMTGSLVLRIFLEWISAVKSKKINLIDNTRETNQDLIRYYRFRKTMHGTVTIALVVIYLAGLLMIMPELSRYIKIWLLVLFNSAFLLSGLFIIYKVRQSIKKEMENLRFFMSIDEQLNE